MTVPPATGASVNIALLSPSHDSLVDVPMTYLNSLLCAHAPTMFCGATPADGKTLMSPPMALCPHNTLSALTL